MRLSITIIEIIYDYRFLQVRRHCGRVDGQGRRIRSADRDVRRNHPVPFEPFETDTLDDKLVLERRGATGTTTPSSGKESKIFGVLQI